jgi:hypothetical protein
LKDELEYIWIDSCCINRDSGAELGEAINSMFRWYHDAVKCYVYLTDVSTSELGQDAGTTKPSYDTAFRKSQWFTRGWTLQELLAPSSVEFYSREGYLLGNRVSMERQINEITKIPVEALRGQPLSHFKVSERMSWTSGRQTTKKEDQAYCLLGIFEVYLPLIYGEGAENAFRRLRAEIATSGVSSCPLTIS